MTSFDGSSVGCSVVPLAGYISVLGVHFNNQFEKDCQYDKRKLASTIISCFNTRILENFGAQLEKLIKTLSLYNNEQASVSNPRPEVYINGG